ncbi:hypothetical protein GLOIN_2v1765192 [Rhizophagus irregularis DAOM 181602=DAOM 197198]|uniref:BTB domain-containing protein n=1 Tax=Rhizophagus irregularis (strain DAOM 181602 / DAOM 197198 / MUCL 43194) TaxID=747089 RepID=A0A2P4QQC0_RHIID|nr:hypothetical protein GLOIN_2v1765192 [Rhizophagus irregularis DAOM 181602=DAOM 197198]POG79847.1 hypothetical protein GLOIN_2v1765192 [Rhizophagus irregularis DAOM 181602=DAOM 197198]|eukprot:XP_025186713.1 hypothetical protein GLOIN_2v1765192 [Rhizophagus irregularis DAOM 181602=DAOM 197198]
MEIAIEYIYNGSIKEESLTKDNIIEASYATDYFHLSELLSKFAEKIPLTKNNILLNLLVKAALHTIEFDRLSIASLQYLYIVLMKEKAFCNEVFRYSATLAAKHDAYKTFMERLPTLEKIGQDNGKVACLQKKSYLDVWIGVYTSEDLNHEFLTGRQTIR